ncbi:MAG TPA: HAMP domain-containing sensor histidine kinase [Vicinamibacteria bacterium]|nr:HAMP domain-containing sensor histidine kinase [Vicinamibacteria bacterium]
MPRKRRANSQERLKTDNSLRTERKKLDDALEGDRTAATDAADGVIDEARAVADDVLTAARVKADDESLRGPRPAEAGAIVGERAKADRVVLGERASADVALSTDRKDRVDALEALLVHERAATDAYLLTERARSDDAVAHRDDFLGMVAHDLRNLLNNVVLTLELLRQTGSGEEPAQAATATSRIRRYVARMNRLIGDLVDVTSIDAGKLAVAPVKGDAATLVTEATETFQPAAVEQGVSLSAEVPAGSLLAEFDQGRLLQVFANLIANALKFTPSGGKITVRVEKGRGILRFSINDTGVGIPATMLETIFERFWQVGVDDRRGQGLGLYISKCIVEAHGGRIWAESEPGKGTRLHFTLPVSSSRRRDSPPSGDAARAKSRVALRGKGRPDRRR